MERTPESGEVKVCVECGQPTAVYQLLPKSIFVSNAEADYPGRLPDAYAWVCGHCGHEDREAPLGPDAPEFPHALDDSAARRFPK